MSLPKLWTPWTTPSGIPLSSYWTQTASKVSRPWGTASYLGPAAAHANCMSSLSSWGRPAHTFSLVGCTVKMIKISRLGNSEQVNLQSSVRLMMDEQALGYSFRFTPNNWHIVGDSWPNLCCYFVCFVCVFLCTLSNCRPELGQWCVVWQCERFHSGAAGQSCVGVWGQGEFYLCDWHTADHNWHK